MNLNTKGIAGDTAASNADEHSIYTLECIYNLVCVYILSFASTYLGVLDNIDNVVFGIFGASPAGIL